MTFSELIEQVKIERANVAAQLNSLDAANRRIDQNRDSTRCYKSDNRADVDPGAKSETERIAQAGIRG